MAFRLNARRLLRDWLFWVGVVLFGWLIFVMITTIQAKGGDPVGPEDFLFIVALPGALTALAVLFVAGVRSIIRQRAARKR